MDATSQEFRAARVPAASVRTFGAFELCFEGEPVQRWRAGKARSLLQYLLLRPGRIASRESLHEALWPGAPWSKGSSSLKVAAHMLRAILLEGGPGGGPGTAPALELVTHESGYALQVRDAAVDFEVFGRLADQAHTAQVRGDRDAAADLYRRAVDLYRDDFLPDVPYDWAAAEREWLRSRLLCALGVLIAAEFDRGDCVGVLRWCRRMLEVEPLHEEAYRALLLVHGHLGQLSQVRRWYLLCSGRLREHLELAPAPMTEQVYARAVRGELVGRALDERLWRQSSPRAAQATTLMLRRRAGA